MKSFVFLIITNLLANSYVTLEAQYGPSNIALATGHAITSGHLYQDSRADLAFARARGDAMVTLAIASREGANEIVVGAIRTAGGTVFYRNGEVSYLRADVPIDQADAIADLDAVESAALDVSVNTTRALLGGLRKIPSTASPNSGDIDKAISYPRLIETPIFNTASQKQRAWRSAWSDDPFTHPYSPVKDLGAANIQRLHPAYDGRGITIAQVEMGIDLLLPEFEKALTLDGRPVPKVIDMRTATDPDHSHDHGAYAFMTPWVKMDLQLTSTSGAFVVGERSYVPPRAGRFRFGIFDGRHLCASLQPRNRENAPAPGFAIDQIPMPDPACRFGVLWDEHTNEIWVDSNRDGSFRDERALTDYHIRHDVGIIGRDDPRTPARESFAFTLQTVPARKAIAINVGIAGHATMVAGSAAASRGTRGRIEGVAPGAQLLVIDWGGECVGSMIEALIEAFSDPRADLVLLEQGWQIAQPYRLGDGRFPATVITSRLIQKYNKPFVVPADNTTGVNTVSEHGNTPWGFAVGAYETKESYQINGGYLLRHDNNLLSGGGSWGPSGIGAIKPDIIVPSGYLTTEMDHSSGIRGVKGLYRLPPGYTIGGGTSQAAPTMAGSLALLMSAAKQEHIPYDAKRIWLAVTNSAHPILNLLTHQQGNGAVDVAAAFELLKAYAKTPPSITIASRGSVRTAYSSWLTTPNEGLSVWEREGWRVGQRGERAVTLTRMSGPTDPMTFTVTWRGNDGTFTSPSSVTLPLNEPVQFPVTILPEMAGAHSALITLDHPLIPGHAYRLMTTIIATEAFDNEFTFRKAGKIERPGPASFYIEVPHGAHAFTINATGSKYLTLLDPVGRIRQMASQAALTWPAPGTWEVGFSVNNDPLDLAWASPPTMLVPRVPYTLNISAVGAQIDCPMSLDLEPRATRTVAVNVKNAFAAFDGGLIPMSIGAARSIHAQLRPREQRVFDVQVPEGSPLLLAQLSGISASDGEVDLYLFDCTDKRCRPAGAAVDSSQPPLLQVNPRAGLWKVVIDASRVPREDVTLDYVDVVADPTLGAVAVTDEIRPRTAGEQWKTTTNVWLAKRPEPGRIPMALFVVNAVSGSTTVPVGLRMVEIKIN